MKPKYLNNLIEDSLFTRMKSGIRKAGLVALAGSIVGVGVYGCKKEEPRKGDTSPIESVEQVEQKPAREYTPPKEPIVQQPPKEKRLPAESVSLEDKLYKQTKIAFTSYRDGNYEIYVMNADGSKQTRLTNNSAMDIFPSLSPDAKKIVFLSDIDDIDGNSASNSSSKYGNFEIYVMNTDGTNQINLTNNPAYDGFPTWSPDGKKITFSRHIDGKPEMFVMNADGSDQIRLTNSPGCDLSLSMPWSPDGKKIVFVSIRDGSKQIRLTDNPAFDNCPSWSPDGKKIVFLSNREGNFEIYVMNTDGTNQTNLTNNPAYDGFPPWSPFLPSEK